MSAATAIPFVAAQLMLATPAHVSVATDATGLESGILTATRRTVGAETAIDQSSGKFLRSIARHEVDTIRPVSCFWRDLEKTRRHQLSYQTSEINRMPLLLDAARQRHLTIDEQNIFHAALRRSVRVIARGARL